MVCRIIQRNLCLTKMKASTIITAALEVGYYAATGSLLPIDDDMSRVRILHHLRPSRLLHTSVTLTKLWYSLVRKNRAQYAFSQRLRQLNRRLPWCSVDWYGVLQEWYSDGTMQYFRNAIDKNLV